MSCDWIIKKEYITHASSVCTLLSYLQVFVLPQRFVCSMTYNPYCYESLYLDCVSENNGILPYEFACHFLLCVNNSYFICKLWPWLSICNFRFCCVLFIFTWLWFVDNYDFVRMFTYTKALRVKPSTLSQNELFAHVTLCSGRMITRSFSSI